MRYVFALLSALSLCLLLSARAEAGYIVTLQNGQTLDTETFTIENSRITLKYKVGEVSFPMSMVKSVTDSEGKGDFLSGPAPQVSKPAEPQTPGTPQQAAQPRTGGQPTPQAAPTAATTAPVPPAAQAAPQTGLPGVIGDGQTDEGEDLDNTDDLDKQPPDADEPDDSDINNQQAP